MSAERKKRITGSTTLEVRRGALDVQKMGTLQRAALKNMTKMIVEAVRSIQL